MENVEVRKWKYENESAERKYGSEVPRLFLCGRGTPPIQEGFGTPVRVYLFPGLRATNQGLTLPAKYGSQKKVRRKACEPYLTSDLETGSWDLGVQRASLSSCHHH